MFNSKEGEYNITFTVQLVDAICVNGPQRVVWLLIQSGRAYESLHGVRTRVCCMKYNYTLFHLWGHIPCIDQRVQVRDRLT